MATYSEFCDLADRFGGVQANADVWQFDIPCGGNERTQKVFVIHEITPPDFEFLLVKSSFAAIAAVDCSDLLKDFGQLNVGAIGYNPVCDSRGNPVAGLLTLSSSIPLAICDLADPTPFFLYLHIFGRAADTIEQKLAVPGTTDFF